jgi:pimeloyl-ACP methyl ester carboxylesterase
MFEHGTNQARRSRRRTAARLLGAAAALLATLAAVGAALQTSLTRRDLARTPPPGRSIDVGGYRLHIWCVGAGGPLVVFDAGLGGSSFDWSLVQPGVARLRRACVYDRAGMGYSERSPRPRTSRQIARELAALLDGAGVAGPVLLVGASSGGFNMRAFADEYAPRVAGLVLVDAAHEDQVERFRAAGIVFDPPWYGEAMPAAASVGLLRWLNVPFGPSARIYPESLRAQARVASFRSSPWQSTVDEFAAAAASASEVRTTRARRLAVPLVVLSAGRSTSVTGVAPGEYARIWRELQADLLTVSAHSCQIVARDSYHDIAIDQPAAVIEAVRVALRAIDANAAPDCSDAAF